MNNIELQGYNNSYNKIALVSNFQNNLISWRGKLGWGLYGCALWRKVTDTVALNLNLGFNFQNNLQWQKAAKF